MFHLRTTVQEIAGGRGIDECSLQTVFLSRVLTLEYTPYWIREMKDESKTPNTCIYTGWQ
jgi:hypothetical protein